MSKITKSAKDEECQIRIPGVCNYNTSTTVLCHLGGAGMGMKHDDLFGAYGCSNCHDEVDRRTRNIDSAIAKIYHCDGIFRTQKILIKKGLIKL